MDRALDKFKEQLRPGGASEQDNLQLSIFGAPGCGVYVKPDATVWYTVVEAAIGFDWSPAHRLLQRVDTLVNHSAELWRAKPATANPDGARTGLKWIARLRKRKQEARYKAAVAERSTHADRVYDVCTSIFSAVNLEKLDRMQRAASNQQLGREASSEFANRVAVIRPQVEQAELSFKAAAQRWAQVRYARGMVAGLILLLALCVGLAIVFKAHHTAAWNGVAILAGGAGAVVSVLQRMASGRLRLDFNAGPGMIAALGAVRPLIGAIFGMVLFCMVEGGWIPIEVKAHKQLPFYAVLGFLAGFNERFAQDMLVGSARQLRGAQAHSDAAEDDAKNP